MNILLAVAAEIEARVVESGLSRRAPAPDHISVLQTGVGKVNAAISTVQAVLTLPPSISGPIWVINLGIAGALPALNFNSPPADLGQVIVSSRSIYADEGVGLPGGGFKDIANLGFPPIQGMENSAFMPDPAASENTLAAIRRHGLPVCTGPIATVSLCSGSDALAHAVAARTGAIAESMEGAAVAHALSRLASNRSLPATRFAEVRVISNTTGDRERQLWEMRGALEILSSVAEALSDL